MPDGLRPVRIPSGRYAQFHAQGDPHEVIWRTWNFINEDWELRARRRHVADCEGYPSAAFRAEGVSASVVVGLA